MTSYTYQSRPNSTQAKQTTCHTDASAQNAFRVAEQVGGAGTLRTRLNNPECPATKKKMKSKTWLVKKMGWPKTDARCSRATHLTIQPKKQNKKSCMLGTMDAYPRHQWNPAVTSPSVRQGCSLPPPLFSLSNFCSPPSLSKDMSLNTCSRTHFTASQHQEWIISRWAGSRSKETAAMYFIKFCENLDQHPAKPRSVHAATS